LGAITPYTNTYSTTWGNLARSGGTITIDGLTYTMPTLTYVSIGGATSSSTKGSATVSGTTLTTPALPTSASGKYYLLTANNDTIGQFATAGLTATSITLTGTAALTYTGQLKVIAVESCPVITDIINAFSTATSAALPTTTLGTFSGVVGSFLTNFNLNKTSANTLKVIPTSMAAIKGTTPFAITGSIGAGFTFTVDTTESIPVAPVSNVTFDSLSASKINGYDYARYQTSTERSWSRMSVPTDISMNILEDQASALFNPYNNLEMRHRIDFVFGDASTIVNTRISISFEKGQLAKIAPAKIGAYQAYALTLRNIGNFSITFD